MKRTLLLVAAAAMAVSANSQITVTNIHVVTSGKNVIQVSDTMPGSGIMPGAPGTGLTWDFSTLANHDEDTLKFQNVGWTPYGANHSGSNLAAQQGSEDFYIYLTNDATGLYMDGFSGDLMGTGSAMHVPADPSEIIAQFPLNYGNSYSGYSAQEFTMDGSAMGADSLRVKFDMNKEVDVDSWGSVTTPMGTFDALRLNEYKMETDSVWAQMFGIWTLVSNSADTSTSFVWWTNDASAGFPLVELDYDSTAGTVRSASYLKSTPSIGIEEQTLESEVYPNPARGMVNISFKENVAGTFYLYSSEGKLVHEQTVNSNQLRFNAAEMSPGVYVYLVKGGNGISQGRLVIR